MRRTTGPVCSTRPPGYLIYPERIAAPKAFIASHLDVDLDLDRLAVVLPAVVGGVVGMGPPTQFGVRSAHPLHEQHTYPTLVLQNEISRLGRACRRQAPAPRLRVVSVVGPAAPGRGLQDHPQLSIGGQGFGRQRVDLVLCRTIGIDGVQRMRLQAGLGDGHRLVCGWFLPGEQFNRAPNYSAVLLFVPGDPRAHPPVLQRVEDGFQVQRPSSLGERFLVIPVELLAVFRVQRGANFAGRGARPRQWRQGWVVRRGRRAGHGHTIARTNRPQIPDAKTTTSG